VDPKVRREALRVAAKLAFAGAAFACGGKLAPEDEASDSSADVMGEAEASTTTCAAAVDAAFDAATIACCTDMMAVVIDAGSFDPTNSAQTSCCTYLDDNASYGSDADNSVAQSCCYLVHSYGSFCNPWGPPTPPAMA
jgi:hypothetical protein